MSDRLLIQSARGAIADRVAFQRPGSPEVLRKVQFPDTDGDRRLYVDVGTLRQLLQMAEASVTHRVVIHSVVVEVEQLRDKTGHVFEAWTFVGHPAPEGATLDEAMKGRVGG